MSNAEETVYVPIKAWEVTTNENGVEMATLNRKNLVDFLFYVESLEKREVELRFLLSQYVQNNLTSEDIQRSEELTGESYKP